MRHEIFFAYPNPLFLDWKDDNGRVGTRTSEAVEQCGSGRYTSSAAQMVPWVFQCRPDCRGGRTGIEAFEILGAKHGTRGSLLKMQIVGIQ